MFLTDDERVIVYDQQRLTHWVAGPGDDVNKMLRNWLGDEQYAYAMGELGLKAVVDL